MKKTQYLVTIMLCLAMAFTLSAQDKYFKEAIKAGRPSNGLYSAVIKGNKKVTLEQLQEKCKKYDYILVDYNNKTVERFGETQLSIGSFRFIPKNEVVAYTFSCLSFANSSMFTDKMQEGTALIPLNFPISKMNPTSMYWSGNVVDGRADGFGYGYGFGDTKTNQVFCFKGNMKNGVPQGEVYVKVAVINDLTKISGVTHTFKVSPLSDGMYRIEENNKFGYIDPYGTCLYAGRFDHASDFINGQAVVSVPSATFRTKSSYHDYPIHGIADSNIEYVIDKSGNYVDFSPNQKRIFDNKIAAIEEQKEKERLAKLEKERQEKLERERQEKERIAAEKRRKREEAAEEKRRKAEEAKKTYHKVPKRETCIVCWGKGYYTTQVFCDDYPGYWYDKTSVCLLCDGKGYTLTHYY